MKYTTVALAGLLLAGCTNAPWLPSAGTGAGAGASVAPEREAAFVAMVEGAGCELDQADNDALLDPAGFSDAEASTISQQLIAEGQAEITTNGNLALLTESCA